ncbi:MAG: hypothetical protein AB8G95_02815 [Anaerolineae bacterium]
MKYSKMVHFCTLLLTVAFIFSMLTIISSADANSQNIPNQVDPYPSPNPPQGYPDPGAIYLPITLKSLPAER